ncbi:sugar-non-specific nuclease inhibitor NuiA-like protein [Deinococcus roseus]|uniref:Sugar-non-specific nuclease inhibitor NuiA-like protein n=2 Tax=Deinococcus roseus TaxID=392414 RepID=A0ABQ2CXW7_9DEIO|nr:sugar-non-specific nuclease inhibitor NuiA-like protein [Deinococcus roseus]
MPTIVQTRVAQSFQSEILQASEGMLFPSESDFPFTAFELPLHALPDAETFAAVVGHAGETSQRLDFSAFFARFTHLEPWMDEGQQAFVLDMQNLQKIYEKHSKKLAVYRIGEIQVHIYIVALVGGRVVGLETLSIET